MEEREYCEPTKENNFRESDCGISFPDPGMIASATGMRARDPWEMEQRTKPAKENPMEATPGPYRVGDVGGFNANHITDPGGTAICAVYGIPLHARVGEVSKTFGRGMANARLLAAAPDLLAACENLCDKIEEAGWHKSETEEARAAIALARGGK